jgi:hypothetical protein
MSDQPDDHAEERRCVFTDCRRTCRIFIDTPVDGCVICAECAERFEQECLRIHRRKLAERN